MPDTTMLTVPILAANLERAAAYVTEALIRLYGEAGKVPDHTVNYHLDAVIAQDAGGRQNVLHFKGEAIVSIL